MRALRGVSIDGRAVTAIMYGGAHLRRAVEEAHELIEVLHMPVHFEFNDMPLRVIQESTVDDIMDAVSQYFALN
jgi:hypothetical protein